MKFICEGNDWLWRRWAHRYFWIKCKQNTHLRGNCTNGQSFPLDIVEWIWRIWRVCRWYEQFALTHKITFFSSLSVSRCVASMYEDESGFCKRETKLNASDAMCCVVLYYNTVVMWCACNRKTSNLSQTFTLNDAWCIVMQIKNKHQFNWLRSDNLYNLQTSIHAKSYFVRYQSARAHPQPIQSYPIGKQSLCMQLGSILKILSRHRQESQVWLTIVFHSMFSPLNSFFFLRKMRISTAQLRWDARQTESTSIKSSSSILFLLFLLFIAECNFSRIECGNVRLL